MLSAARSMARLRCSSSSNLGNFGSTASSRSTMAVATSNVRPQAKSDQSNAATVIFITTAAAQPAQASDALTSWIAIMKEVVRNTVHSRP